MKALVLLSGGVDSATCLYHAVEKYGEENITALRVSYGQKHDRELDAAETLAEYCGAKLHTLDLTEMFSGSGCALLQSSPLDIPHGEYAEQLARRGEGEMLPTYVPFRNGLFLAAAASVAMSLGCGVIYYGAHADDSAGNAYPDCSETFFKAMNDAIYEGSGGKLTREAPFINKTKTEVIKEGMAMDVPYHLTWSCYEGNDEPCGICATCIDRRRAFEKNGVPDPAARM
jgi:7-cyano-7-deazaguanine synthase